MLAHQLGFPLPNKVMSEIWDWEKLWKESGQDLQETSRVPILCRLHRKGQSKQRS